MFEQIMIAGLSGGIIIACIYIFKRFRNKLTKHWHYLVVLIANFVLMALLVNFSDAFLWLAMLLELSFVILIIMWISFTIGKKNILKDESQSIKQDQ
jgi:hypothetical protein